MSAGRRIRVFQHVPFEDVGSLSRWAATRGHRLDYTRLFAGDLPPDPSAYDMLIVMGGPMGANDDAILPWMLPEKRALSAALDAGRPVLGICLGAQLLASVLGARVFRNAHTEIGWHEIRRDPAPAGTFLAEAFPERFTAFHWHGDTFDMPAGAVRFGSSDACPNQGFLLGDRVLALQFHPEVTAESIEALIRECGHELRPGPYVQDAAALREGEPRCAGLNRMAAEACARLESACMSAPS